jgi:hypothetical protein
MRAELVKSTFAIHEAVVLTGFSKYMLDYLAREDIFRPTQAVPTTRGRRRSYAYQDVVLLRALHAICAGKGKIRHLNHSLAALRAEIGPLLPGQRVERLLFVEGAELCLRTARDGGQQLRTGQLTFAFFVDLRAVSDRLAEVVSIDTASGAIVLDPGTASLAETERMRTWGVIRARRLAQAG